MLLCKVPTMTMMQSQMLWGTMKMEHPSGRDIYLDLKVSIESIQMTWLEPGPSNGRSKGKAKCLENQKERLCGQSEGSVIRMQSFLTTFRIIQPSHSSDQNMEEAVVVRAALIIFIG